MASTTTLCTEQTPSQYPSDLKVKIQNSSLVFPSQETERKCMFLSNIDQVLNFDVQTVHFFQPNKDFPPQVVIEKLKKALGQALVPYDCLAGRLKTNPKTGRLEIDCNAKGVVFLEASSEYSLNEIGDLVYPNPAFAQFADSKTFDALQPGDDPPLCILQVTSFKRGGFVMGITTNHSTFDGISFKYFLQNLAALASDKPLPIIPCNNRQLLAARTPPHVMFPHNELLKLKTKVSHDHSQPPVFEVTPEDLELKVFKLTSNHIATLKERAKPTGGGWVDMKNKGITGFNVVTAHIWRCKALSYDSHDQNNMERSSTLLYAVDIRQRLDPPLPSSYLGNAVLTAYATAQCKELEEGPFSKLVEMVYEGSQRITNEYARSAIDWGELYLGFPNGEFLVSSWWRLGFSEVEYPWGRPSYSCPVVCQRKDMVLLFPDINEDQDGVNVLVVLPKKEMDKFQTFFHEFLV